MGGGDYCLRRRRHRKQVTAYRRSRTTTAGELVVIWTGISSGTEYSVDTVDHPVSDDRGVFSAFERDTSHNRDVLKVLFTKNGDSVPFELLMDDIDLIIASGTVPSVVLFMDTSRTYGTKEKIGDGPCAIVVRGVWFFCESLDRAVITVPPAMRDTIFYQGKSG